MTATIIDQRPVAAFGHGRTAGLRALVRKDISEWIHGTRAWVVFSITTVFMVLTAANAWLITQISAMLPPDAVPPTMPDSLAPLDNLGAALGAQVFVLAAIFAVASLLVRERESGTLAWVASKPVSRDSIWLAKWISASGMLIVSAVVAPLAVTFAVVSILYGVPALVPVAILVLGAAAVTVFYTALGLAAGTVLPGQPAVVAVGFGVFALAPMLAAIIPLPIAPYLPTSIFEWSAGLATGADVGWVTPIAFVLWTAAIAGLAIRRMRTIEL